MSIPIFFVQFGFPGIRSYFFIVLGILSFIIGLSIVINSKPKYILLLNTRDGVIKDLVTKNLDQLELIADAITKSNSLAV